MLNVLTKRLQTLQNRCLRICTYKNYHISVGDLHELCSVTTLKPRNSEIVNNREVFTRMHDATLYVTNRPKSENYKISVLYKGALIWNSMTVQERSIETYGELKKILKTLVPLSPSDLPKLCASGLYFNVFLIILIL